MIAPAQENWADSTSKPLILSKSEQKSNSLATFCFVIPQVSSSPPQKATEELTFYSCYRDGMNFPSHDYRYPVDGCLMLASHSGLLDSRKQYGSRNPLNPW